MGLCSHLACGDLRWKWGHFVFLQNGDKKTRQNALGLDVC